MKKVLVILIAGIFTSALLYAQDDDTTRNVLKQGLLGAGTGAIASGASGGNAGKGALIGAGAGAIGGILLDALTSPSSSSSRSSRRRASNPPPDDYYTDDQQQQAYYEEPPQESGTQKVLKQGLLGAGTGAIAAGASGGKAGQGALIGAGTGVIGGALLDAITQPSQPKRVYRRVPSQQQVVPQQYVQQAPPQQYAQQTVPQENVQVTTEPAGADGGKKKIVKRYDASGKLISEEETYF